MKFLIITHGRLAEGLIDAGKIILGEIKDTEIISFNDSMGIETLEEMITNHISNITDDLIIFTDLLGGTPFNATVMATENYKNIKIIYGINLPIFIECYMNKDNKTLEEIVNLIDEIKNETIGTSNL